MKRTYLKLKKLRDVLVINRVQITKQCMDTVKAVLGLGGVVFVSDLKSERGRGKSELFKPAFSNN